MPTNINAAKRYKDIDLPYKCPVTNRIFNSTKGISIYVTKTLKMDHKLYYDTYINHRDRTCFFCNGEGYFMSIGKGYRNLCSNDECLKKSFNTNSVEGIMYRNQCNRKEAEITFESENQNQLDKRTITNNKNLKKDPLLYKKRSRNCKEFWMEKGLSEEDSILKSEEVMKDIHIKTSIKKKSNKEFYKKTYTTNIEYYLNKGYSEDDSLKILSDRQTTFSKEKCIEKHGEEIGLYIWNERQEKWLKTLDSKSDEEKILIGRKKLMNHSGYSKISQTLFWDIYNRYKQDNIHFEELNHEIIRYDKINKKHYRYDFINFTKKKVIEYNGDYWHCNPIKYNEDFKHPIIKKTASEIWYADYIKINWIKNRNYDVLVVWDSEYRKNPKQITEKCIEFLNN